MAGGDLFQHLCDVRKLATGPARFYAAEVLLALGFIHSSNHVYRDLKPENSAPFSWVWWGGEGGGGARGREGMG